MSIRHNGEEIEKIICNKNKMDMSKYNGGLLKEFTEYLTIRIDGSLYSTHGHITFFNTTKIRVNGGAWQSVSSDVTYSITVSRYSTLSIETDGDSYSTSYYYQDYDKAIKKIEIRNGHLLKSLRNAHKWCYNFEEFVIDNCENITDFGGAFHYCHKLKTVQNLSKAKATNFAEAFRDCELLTRIEGLDTRNATNKEDMFLNTPLLVEPNISQQADITDSNGALWIAP